MNKEKVVPKIRFKMFSEDLKEFKLGSITDRVRGNDGRMELLTLTISAGNGWLDQRERFSGNIAGKEQKNYTLLRKGELSYNKGNSKLAKYGVVFMLDNFEEALVPRVYHSFRVTKKASARYIEYLFATKKPDRELRKLITSGARMDGLLNINYDDFMGIKITIPKVEEQIIIGSFFNKVDETIRLQQQLLNDHKQLKKAMLQKMIPQKGENVPRVRFAGYTSEWEIEPLSRLGKIMTGSTPSTLNKDNYSNEGILWITPTDIKGRIVTNTSRKISEMGETGARIAPAGTILVTSIASIGKNTLLLTRAGFNQQINSLTPNKNNDSYFLFTQSKIWSEKMKRVASSGIMQIVNKTEFSSIKTSIPQLEEQIKIGKIFKKLDETIELHEQKLETYQNLKKAMLQKMFV